MTARLTVLETREAVVDDLSADANLQPNTVVLYEHRNFAENGRIRHLIITEFSPQDLYSLHVIDFKDCLSSLKWNLDPGIVVVFYEDHDGGGRRYEIIGTGEDKDTHNNNFKDCASSWRWYRGA